MTVTSYFSADYVEARGKFLDACRAGGYKVPVEPREIRPGVTIAMVEDPDGNWVEFLQTS